MRKQSRNKERESCLLIRLHPFFSPSAFYLIFCGVGKLVMTHFWRCFLTVLENEMKL